VSADHCPHGGLEFELQRRLDDALNSLTVLDRDDLMVRSYWHGVTEGVAAALGALRGTNAAHELAGSAERIVQ
jgi:hypothetical protein